MSGRVVQRTATSVEVNVGAGKITVPADRVERIEERRSPLDDYYDRAGRLAATDAAGWQALGRWASDQGLSSQAREAYTRLLAVLPTDPEANGALGRVSVEVGGLQLAHSIEIGVKGRPRRVRVVVEKVEIDPAARGLPLPDARILPLDAALVSGSSVGAPRLTTATLYATFFVSGLASLVFETLWFRQAGLVFGNTVWATAITTASFMAGLGLGSAIAARFGGRFTQPLRAYAVLEVVAGVAGLASCSPSRR